MTAKHTQGPWFIGKANTNKAPAIIGDKDSIVAYLPGDWNYCTYKPADAALIAAAPELLSDLEFAVNILRAHGYTLTAKNIQQTIDKAKGESNEACSYI